jgi:hypothetical protein
VVVVGVLASPTDATIDAMATAAPSARLGPGVPGPDAQTP